MNTTEPTTKYTNTYTPIPYEYHRTNNTIYKHLYTGNTVTPADKYNQSGVYKLTCQNCNKAYIGRTARNFCTRYKEHQRAFQYNTHQSKFTVHLQDHGHSFGTIENTMKILKIQGKETHLNTVEKYYIHRETLGNNQLNEDYADTSGSAHLFMQV
jgi:hypothetical protein